MQLMNTVSIISIHTEAREILYTWEPIKIPEYDTGNGPTGISRAFITFQEQRSAKDLI